MINNFAVSYLGDGRSRFVEVVLEMFSAPNIMYISTRTKNTIIARQKK